MKPKHNKLNFQLSYGIDIRNSYAYPPIGWRFKRARRRESLSWFSDAHNWYSYRTDFVRSAFSLTRADKKS